MREDREKTKDERVNMVKEVRRGSIRQKKQEYGEQENHIYHYTCHDAVIHGVSNDEWGQC